MAPAVGVDYWSVAGFRHCLDGCIQHCVDQLSVRARANGSADNHAVEAIDDRRQVDLARRDLELRDIREPFLIGGRGLEVAVYEFSGAGLISPR